MHKFAKRFFSFSFFTTCLAVVFVLIFLNTCIFGNLKSILNKYGKLSGQFNSINSGKLYGYDTQTIVRVVPLSWRQDIDNKPNISDGSAKYRFLRQQGLTPFRKLPGSLIIGVKKGGTRALLEFVRLHPDVRAAGSEVHFFDKYYRKGFKWYRHSMPATLEGQVTMEKTPSYFVTKEVPKRVYKMNPAMKLVVVVRDPVTRAVSDYTQAASKKPDMKRFEELAFSNGSDGVVNTSWGPIRIGVYAKHLDRWMHYFPL